MARLRVTPNAAQWLSTAFMLTMAAVIPITGWFLQRVTTRSAYATAMVDVPAGHRAGACVAPDVRGAAGRPHHPGGRHRGDDAAADDHADARGARARPRPGDGQRHPGHLGRAGAGPGGLRSDPQLRFVAAACSPSCCRSPPPSPGAACGSSRTSASRRPAPSTGSAWRWPPLGFGGLVYGLSEFATRRPAPAAADRRGRRWPLSPSSSSASCGCRASARPLLDLRRSSTAPTRSR